MAKEKTIKQKEKDLQSTYVLGGVLLTIFCGYFALMTTACQYDYPTLTIFEAMAKALELIGTSPAYFYPFPENGYNMGLFAAVVTLCPAICFVSYTFAKLRVHHDINTLKGSSKWANLQEMVRKYADFDSKKSYKTAYYNAILSENFQMSINHGKHYHALSTLVLGATGSGKSRFLLKPNLLQMNTSYVITDPSGGILMETGEALRRFGYKVKVFDLVAMGSCDTYNPLKYCFKESDIKKVVQAFIKNTDPTGGKGNANKDPFWDDAMNAFMCSGIAFLTQKPDGEDLPYAQIPEITGGVAFEPCFANLCELTRMANNKWTPSSNIKPMPGVKLGDGKNNTANASELAMIFENIRAYECARQNCSPEEMQKPYALREWENFRIAPEKTSTTILMTAAVRLDPFNIEQVRELTSSDTLDLENFGNSRDALFVITPTNDRTYNFLVSFLYTQLFDILYKNGETKSAGSKDIKLANGELVKHFSKEEVNDGAVEAYLDTIKSPVITKIAGGGKKTGYQKIKKKFLGFKWAKKVKISYDDGWYDINTSDGILITRRPTKQLATQFVSELSRAKVVPGNGKSVPTHVRFLLDEFPNLGEIPEFKEKLATMRKYEISCMVICQTITQLKGMYPEDYEVIDANCPQTIFIGGDENSNNEYISKKIGMSTVKGWNNSVDAKRINMSYNVEQRELMRPEDLGRMPFEDEVILIYGEDPIYDQKYDYPSHKNYKYTHDYAVDLGIHDGCVYSREKYEVLSAQGIIHKFLTPEATPGVEKLETADDFRQRFSKLFGTSSVDNFGERTESAYKRTSFEESSEAQAF